MEQFIKDKAEWQWDSAYKEYIESNNINNRELTSEEEEEVWALASGHIVYFFTWIIKHDLYNKEIDMYDLEDVNNIKNETLDAFKYFEANNDLVLAREDIDPKILNFMDEYYDKLYIGDYYSLMDEQLKLDKTYIKFDYELYHKLEPIIDAAFDKYNK